MKKLLSKMQKKVVSGALAFSMMFSFCYNAFPKSVFEHEHVHAHAEETDTINYVSLGDSMTNGYGFEGYRQGNYAEGDSFPYGTGIYGEGSYALQFADWLEEETGKEVNHAQMASSACRAEDLLYLLGGREKPTDGWFTQVLNYTGASERKGRLQIVKGGEEELKQLYVENITNADIISLAVGNASFGAYLMQYMTSAMGVFGASLPEDEIVTFEDALVVLEDEQAEEYVMKAYDKAMAEFYKQLPEGMADVPELKMLEDVMSYLVAGFLLNYKGVVEKIVELNPDVEIVLVGLMNTTSGIKLTDENGDVLLNVGDMLDSMFGILNTYVETLPAVLKLAKKTADAEFYYVENLHINFISQEFPNLAANGWQAIDYTDEDGNVYGRLSGDVVRNRTIESYNDALAPMIGAGFGMDLPTITLADVQAFETNNPDWSYPVPQVVYEDGKYVVVLDETFNPEYYNIFYPDFDKNGKPTAATAADLKTLAVAIYLGIEDAIAASMGAFDVPVDALMNIADMDAMAGVLSGFMPNLNPSEMLSDTEFGIIHPVYGYITGAQAGFAGYELPYYGEEGIDAPVDVRNDLGTYFTSTETMQAMCLIFGMFKIGNGMSVHPTPKTHHDIFNKIVETYTAGYTTDDAFQDNAEAWAEELKELAKEYGPEIIEKAKPLIKKYGPEVAKQIPGWIREYGPSVLEVIEEYGPVVVEKLAPYVKEYAPIVKEKACELVKKYGPDIVKQIPGWIREYGPSVLEFIAQYGPVVVSYLAPFVKEYGPIVASKAYEYAVNAGYVAIIEETMATVEGKLVEARANLVALREMIIAGAYEVNNNIVNGINGAKDFVSRMSYTGASNKASAVAMRSTINAVPCQTVIEQAQNAVNDAVTSIENQINAQVQDLLAVVDAKLAEIDALIAESVKTAVEMVVEVVANVRTMITSTVNQTKAYVEETIAKVEAQVIAFNAKVEAAVEEFVAVATETIAVIEENVQRLAEEAQEKYLELVAAIEEAKATVERTVEFINMFSNLTFTNIRETYEGAFVTDYEYLDTDEKTLNYLALGDATVNGHMFKDAEGKFVRVEGYANRVAELWSDWTVNVTKNVDAGTIAALEANLKNDAFVAQIENADVISVNFSNTAILDFVKYQIFAEALESQTPVELDWAKVVGEENVAYVDEVLAIARTYLETQVGTEEIDILGTSVSIADAAMIAIESYAYSYVELNVNYMQAINSITAINPNAKVLMVGLYNPFKGLVVEGINVGEYFDYLVNLMGVEYAVYAMASDNFAFIDVTEVEMVGGFAESDSIGEVLITILSSYEFLVPTADSYAYMAEQVAAAINFVEIDTGVGHVHNYEAVVTDPTCTEDGYTTYTCACGDSYVADYVTAPGHDYEAVVTDPTCTEEGYTTYTCACGDSYVADKQDALDHNYGAWVSNGDGTHTKTCGRDATHTVTENCSGGTATCTQKGVCTECGAEYINTVDHTYDQEVVDDQYLVSGATCTDKAVYKKSCTCGAAGTETFEYGTALDHNYGAWVSNGDGTHTKTCGRDATHTVTENCSGGTATCTNKAVCSECNAEYGNVLDHTYSTTYTYDEDSHWYECSCGAKKNVANHNFVAGNEVDGVVTYSCQCGKTKLHGHNYSVTYDENNHWYECSCGKKKDVAPHELNDGIESNGKITYSCCSCGYSEAEDVEPVSTGAIIAVAASALVVAGGGGFTLVWFGVYKKSAADLVNAVKKLFKKKK